MTEFEIDAKLAELDRLLNDPAVRLDPDRVWTLLAEVAGRAALPGCAAPPATAIAIASGQMPEARSSAA